jgi:hypothetical protein
MKLSNNTDLSVPYETNKYHLKIVVYKNSKTMDKYSESGICQLCCPDCRKIMCWTSSKIFPRKKKKVLVNILRVIDGKILLKIILEKQTGRVGTDCTLMRIGNSVGQL